MEIDNLTKNQLEELKKDIQKKMNDIILAEKNFKSNKEKNRLIDLKKGDNVWGIRFCSNHGHKLEQFDVEKDILNWCVDIVDLCEIETISKHENQKDWKNYYRVDIHHKSGTMGNMSNMSKEELEKHYCLFLDDHTSGYETFYTLKPESWKEDLIDGYNQIIERRNDYHNKQNKIIELKLLRWLDFEDHINELI